MAVENMIMSNLVAYQIALEVIRKLRPIVEQIKMHDAHLADQLRRAATTTVANLRGSGGQRRATRSRSPARARTDPIHHTLAETWTARRAPTWESTRLRQSASGCGCGALVTASRS